MPVSVHRAGEPWVWEWSTPSQPSQLKLDPCKCMGLYRIHPRILKEQGDVIAKPFTMIFKQSWKSWEVPADRKLASIVSVLRRAGRRTLETTGLSVSIQCVVKLRGRLFWEMLKNTWKTKQSLVTASTASWKESPAYWILLPFMTG